MNNKLLFKNAFFVAGQTITLGIVWIILYRYLLDTIGIEKLGVWSIILAATSASRIGEMGLTASVTKFIATHRSEKDEKAATEVLQTAALSLGAGLAVILILIYPIMKWGLPFLLPENGLKDGLSILPYAFISFWFATVGGIWMSCLDGCLRSDIRSGLMIISNLILLIVSISLVKQYGLVGLALAQIIQGCSLFILGWIAVKNVMPTLPLLPSKWSRKRFSAIIGYGVNFQINTFVMMLFDPITKILFGRFGDLATVGYFEMAQRIVMMVRSLVIASNQVIVPVFASLGKNSNDTAKHLYTRNMQYLIFMITPIFAALIAMMPAISEIWLGSYQHKFVVLGICLTLAWYFNSINAPAYYAFLGQGRLRWVTLGFITMGITNISVGIPFGLLYGWQGVAFANIIALILGSVIITYKYHSEKNLRINQILSKHDAAQVFIYFFLAVIMLICYWYMIKISVNLWTRISIILILISASSFMLIWYHPIRKEIFQIIKNLRYPSNAS